MSLREVTVEHVHDFVLTSIPVTNGVVTMRDLRDFALATEDAPEDAHVVVLDGEIRLEVLL